MTQPIFSEPSKRDTRQEATECPRNDLNCQDEPWLGWRSRNALERTTRAYVVDQKRNRGLEQMPDSKPDRNRSPKMKTKQIMPVKSCARKVYMTTKEATWEEHYIRAKCVNKHRDTYKPGEFIWGHTFCQICAHSMHPTHTFQIDDVADDFEDD